jgi:hypothetical protein
MPKNILFFLMVIVLLLIQPVLAQEGVKGEG